MSSSAMKYDKKTLPFWPVQNWWERAEITSAFVQNTVSQTYEIINNKLETMPWFLKWDFPQKAKAWRGKLFYRLAVKGWRKLGKQWERREDGSGQ